MNFDISNFIEIVPQKAGKPKLRSSKDLQANTNQLLHSLGFRVCKVKGRRVYYQRSEGKIVPVTLHEIKDAFTKFLERIYLDSIPEGVAYDRFMNWYYAADPIKENQDFSDCLREELNEQETHSYLLEHDVNYRSDIQLEHLLTKFDEWGLSRVIDSVHSKSKMNDRILYYKHIEGDKFLVFTQWNTDTKYNTGFDTGIATYRSKKDIGVKAPFKEQHIRSSFELERDFALIEQYVYLSNGNIG